MFRSIDALVKARPLLVVLAAAFAGMTMLLVLGAAVAGQPLVLIAAVPLAVTAVMMWYQGTGKLGVGVFRGASSRRRGRRSRTRGYARRTADGGSTTAERGADAGHDPWEVPFEEEARRERRTRARRQAYTESDETTAGNWGSRRQHRDRRDRPDRLGGMTEAEAYEVLGLDPTAGEDEVRDAYREQAKEVHPDTEGGSAEAFQELNDAYERLVDD